MTKRLDFNLYTSRKRDFVSRLVREMVRRHVRTCRIHVSGDFYSAAYARKWLEVVERCEYVRFFAYTRSWRVATIATVLEQLALLPNMRLWYSMDAETGVPTSIPKGVRLAYLMRDWEEVLPSVDLVFRTQSLRRTGQRIELNVVCPHEDKPSINCETCKRCMS